MAKAATKVNQIVGVCLGYQVSTAKTGTTYADIRLRDQAGKVYDCKMWNWKSDFKQYLYPRKYVVIAQASRSDYNGKEQYIISDIQVETDADIRLYDSTVIDTQAQMEEYRAWVNATVTDSNWLAIISAVIDVNRIELQEGVIDDRIGGNQHGTMLQTVMRVSKMAVGVAAAIKFPVSLGYMAYCALISNLAKGMAYNVNEDGNVEIKEETNFFGIVGLPVLSMPSLLQSDAIKDMPDSYKQLMVQGLLSTTPAAIMGNQAVTYSNTLEGRIIYHCATLDRTSSVMEQYVADNVASMLSIPDLVSADDRNIKFLVPSRLTTNT